MAPLELFRLEEGGEDPRAFSGSPFERQRVGSHVYLGEERLVVGGVVVVGFPCCTAGTLARGGKPQMHLCGWGSGGHGVLVPGSEEDHSVPCSVPRVPDSCGGTHCAAVQDGTLAVWGDRSHGQSPAPAAVQGVKRVVCGWWHTVVETEGGCLEWGFLMGRKAEAVRSVPVQPTLPLRSLAAGWKHSALVDAQGRVSVWGDEAMVPSETVEKAVQVACGWRHTVTLLEDGSVLAWGGNRFGQLGNPKCTEQKTRAPQRMAFDEKVVSVASGWYHVLLLTESYRVFAVGRNSFGQLGHPSVLHSSTPLLVDCGVPIDAIHCGSEHSIAVTQDRTTLYLWGWNEHGNLGLGHHNNQPSPQPLRFQGRIDAVVTGGASVFAAVSPL